MSKNIVIDEWALPPVGDYTVHVTTSLISDDRVEMRLDAFNRDPSKDKTDFTYRPWGDFQDVAQRKEHYKRMYEALAWAVFEEAFNGPVQTRELT